MDEKKSAPQMRYDKKAMARISLKFHLENDKDILSALEGKPKQTEIKRLLRIALKEENQ